MVWLRLYTKRFLIQLFNEVSAVTRPEKALVVLVVLAGMAFQALQDSVSAAIKSVSIASAFSILWAACAFGCWLAYKAAKVLYFEDIRAFEDYKPSLHFVGDPPVRKRPSAWKAATPATLLNILLISLIIFSAQRIPSARIKSDTAAIDRLGLRDLFRMDFAGAERTSRTWYVNPQNGHPGFEFEYAIVGSYLYNSKFLVYYLSATENTRESCVWLATHSDSIFNDGVRISCAAKIPGDSGTRSTEAEVFTGNVYIYHETYLPQGVVASLTKQFAENKQSVIFRSADYLYTRKLEMKLARNRR